MSTYRVCAQIDLDAFEHNVLEIKNKLSDSSRLMGVIKMNAYGHGSGVLGKELERLGASWFAVACVDEGIELRRAGLTLPILVLGFTSPDQYAQLLEYDITPTVFSYEMACAMNEAAKAWGSVLNVHIKLDTGMGRIGFWVDEESLEAICKIQALEFINIEGLFTHFACADMNSADAKEVTSLQRERFIWMSEQLKAKGVDIKLHHCANSAGIMNGKDFHEDMVRAGIILYGLYPSDEVDRTALDLKPVMSLKSHITYIKTLQPGQGISYGYTYVTDKETVVATIPVGYGDGYPRQLSNQGSVLIRGHKVPIIGRVCMDQFMVDITGYTDICEGDEVTLFGYDGDAQIPVEEVAALAGSFNYEFVCDVGRRVPRAYMRNGQVEQVVSYLD